MRWAAQLPTLPKPWIATVVADGSRPRRLHASMAMMFTPRPVALGLPSLPPMSSGLPVTDAGTEYPACIESVSMIQAMISPVVLTSGAGMSDSGPTRTLISAANRRVSRSSSRWLSSEGSTATPPLAPPYGRLVSAHFHVIHMASALTSSRSVSGWNRRPPLAGPRVTLCWTR